MMGKFKPKYRITCEKNGGFLLGANINISKWDGELEVYLVVYIGTRSLVLGRF